MSKLQTEELVLSTSVVRNNFAEFMDSVVKTPKIIKRRKEQAIVLSIGLLESTINYTIHVEKLDDGTFYGYLNELKGAYGYGDTVDNFVEELSISIESYVDAYLSNFADMVSTPGTKEQALIILSLQDKDTEEIRGIINGKMERPEKVLSE